MNEARAYMPISKSDNWETPKDLFDQLWETFGGFDLDPCGKREHYTAQRIFENGGGFYDGRGEALDGLIQPWFGKVYMNPPYGRRLGFWVEKVDQEAKRTELIVALLPVRTDTGWWQEYVMRSSVIGMTRPPPDVYFVPTLPGGGRYHTTRLHFGGVKNSAPFPSAIVVWRTP